MRIFLVLVLVFIISAYAWNHILHGVIGYTGVLFLMLLLFNKMDEILDDEDDSE